MNKIEKSRENDNYALVYCKGKNGIEKLIKSCNKNKKNFWIVEKYSRKEAKECNNIFKMMCGNNLIEY
jgi:hypothetical protein